jgi:hypothetical protein
LLSFNAIAARPNLPDEISLHAKHWEQDGHKYPNLPTNAIAVSSRRAKALFDYSPVEDPLNRSPDPRWKQYWMSLWGATIEAIALSWGAQLQEVLVASEIASDGFERIEDDGHPAFRLRVDLLRKPKDVRKSGEGWMGAP